MLLLDLGGLQVSQTLFRRRFPTATISFLLVGRHYQHRRVHIQSCGVDPQHVCDVQCIGVSEQSIAQFVIKFEISIFARIFEVDVPSWQTISCNLQESDRRW